MKKITLCLFIIYFEAVGKVSSISFYKTKIKVTSVRLHQGESFCVMESSINPNNLLPDPVVTNYGFFKRTQGGKSLDRPLYLKKKEEKTALLTLYKYDLT